MPNSAELLTTGYAGHNPDSFLAKLLDHDVQTVVDVRQNPVSRKRGFSKSQLERFLGQHDIGYAHVHELGVPRELRDRLQGGDCELDVYFADFSRYLATQGAALAALLDRALHERCCLLCVESRPDDCHRSQVADVLVASAFGKLAIKHI